MARHISELPSAREPKALEKASKDLEAVSVNQEAIQTAIKKPRQIKRGKQRAAVALAASNVVFNVAVLQLQGLHFLKIDYPHQFLIKKLLPCHFGE
jgi:hypothetical protein